jgi:hypothetical protein
MYSSMGCGFEPLDLALKQSRENRNSKPDDCEQGRRRIEALLPQAQVH